MKKIKITVKIEKTDTGFSAYAKEVNGLITVGESLSEIKENFKEVFDHHVEYIRDQGSDFTKKNFEINYEYPKVTSGQIAEAIRECLKTIEGVDDVSVIMTDGNIVSNTGKKFSLYTIQNFPEVRKQVTVTITDNRPD